MIMERNQIIDIMKEIGEISAKYGLDTYAVGGLVRDFMMEKACDDLDITSDNIDLLAEQIINVGGKAIEKNSERFMGKIVYFRGLKIDLVAPRKESYREDSIKPIVKVGTFQDDVERRDYTINALYYDLHPDRFMEIVDLTRRGLSDFKKKILDTPIDPIKTFIDDPSRMLRGVRFAATHKFRIASRVRDAIFKLRENILRIPFEIVHNEMIKGAISSDYFRVMDDVGLVDVLFPELALNRGVYQHPLYHTEDVFEHIIRTTECLKTTKPLLRIASLLHDMGKAAVDDGSGHAYNHIGRGLPIIKRILRRYKFSNHEIQYIYDIIRFHHAFHNFANLKLLKEPSLRRSVRKFVTNHSMEFVQDIYEHTLADIRSDSPQRKKFVQIAEEMMDLIHELDLTVMIENSRSNLTVTGHDIMALGYRGKEVGRVKRELQTLVDEGIIPNTRASLLEKLKQYAH